MPSVTFMTRTAPSIVGSDPDEQESRRTQKKYPEFQIEGEGVVPPQGDEGVPEPPAGRDEQWGGVGQKRGEHSGLCDASVAREQPEDEPLRYRCDEGSGQNEGACSCFGAHRSTR